MRITSFEVKNFRAFDHLALEGFERVNLIAGDNNVGKTALLEALWQFLGPNQPDIGIRLDLFRGITAFDSAEVLFDCFHQYETSKPIEMRGYGDWGVEERALSISVEERDTSQIALENESPDGAQRITDSSAHEIVLRYSADGEVYESRGWPEPGPNGSVFQIEQHSIPGKLIGHFLGARQRTSPDNDAKIFSDQVIRRKEREFLAVLQVLDSRIRRLETAFVGGVPMIHADVGLDRLIPLGLLGDGVQRALTWSLALSKATGGVILIDEIENGVHFSRLKDLWTALSHLSESFDVQVFATTHSLECVEQAHEAFCASGSYDFRYFRIDRDGDKTLVKSYDREVLATALELDFEIR